VSIRTINPAAFGPPLFPYSQAAVGTGEIIFVAGQVALDPDNNIVGVGDSYEQTKYLLDRMRITLAEAGAGLEDIAYASVYLTDRKHAAGFNKAWVEEFGEHRPARAGIVTELLVDDALVEVQAVALK
jgi:2-iminobutanoate/2-iminopropanoate deaminase